MEEKDLKQIKEAIDQSFDDKFGQIWEHNLAPAFDEINERFVKVESQMATKSYIDDKMADLEGGLVVKLRKEDEKVNRVIIDLLKKHKVVPIED